MRRILISAIAYISTFGIAALSYASPESWRNDKECGKRLPIPIKAEIAGCQKAFCIQLLKSSRICSCLSSIEDDEGNNEGSIFIERSGKIVERWKAKLYPPADENSFRVDSVKRTDNEEDDLLVGAMETQSNGMGVQYWTVWVVSKAGISKPLDIQDYGIVGFLTRGTGEKECNLLATRWMEGSEPERGTGLYLVGRWFKVIDGNLTPHFNRPAIYRRYLLSFQQQRNNAMSTDQPKPLLWFHDK